MLNIPPPQTPQIHPWVPPSSPVVAKSFPQAELRDVDMAEASPPRPPSSERPQDERGDEGKERLIATGGLKRVFKARMRKKEKSSLVVARAHVETEDDADSEPENDSETTLRSAPLKTSNHYTLNMPPPIASRSDIPYVLLGYVYIVAKCPSAILMRPQLFTVFLQPLPYPCVPVSSYTVHSHSAT